MDQRFSVQLKDSTRGMHDFLSSTPGAATLLAGQMSKEAYALYLFGIWHLYDALEPALDLHSTHPVLAPVYNPTLLRRKESISSDIAYFLGCSSTSPSEWQQHPLYTESFLPIPAPIAAYVSHINALSQSPDPSLLLTHSYIRYVGDMNGGQIIKRVLMKAYNLTDERSMSFYAFAKLGGASGEMASNMGDVAKLIKWYKAGMDEGVGDNMELREKLIEETLTAYKFNGAIFDLITPATTTVEDSDDTAKVPSSANHSSMHLSTMGKAYLPLFGIGAAAVLAHLIMIPRAGLREAEVGAAGCLFLNTTTKWMTAVAGSTM